MIAGFVVWGVLRSSRPRPLFAVRLINGEPRATVGTVTAPFLARVREVAAEHRIATGSVWGVVRSGGRVSLKCSGHFPPGAQQQLRNWWAVSGWTAPVKRRRR
ncbi:MAG TPA: DUF3634 family protein [Gemmata sp.]